MRSVLHSNDIAAQSTSIGVPSRMAAVSLLTVIGVDDPPGAASRYSRADAAWTSLIGRVHAFQSAAGLAAGTAGMDTGPGLDPGPQLAARTVRVAALGRGRAGIELATT